MYSENAQKLQYPSLERKKIATRSYASHFIQPNFGSYLLSASLYAILDEVSYCCTPQCRSVMGEAQFFRKVGRAQLRGRAGQSNWNWDCSTKKSDGWYIWHGNFGLISFYVRVFSYWDHCVLSHRSASSTTNVHLLLVTSSTLPRPSSYKL